MTDFIVPVTIGPTGRVNTPPSVLQQYLINYVATQRPGYTANLPGSLIEDISSTDVGALLICDQLLTELVNSISATSANPFILYQLGQQFGVPLGQTTNTSVYVVFSGSPGYVIPVGFTVSDGAYLYTVQDGGVINTSGSTSPLYCLAVESGSWPVPPGSVTEVVTSVPSPFTVTCTNPQAGTPSAGDQTEEEYRAQVMLAGQAPAASFASMAKSYLGQVPGVQSRLVSFQQQSPGWKAIIGGGDPYEVAYAIFNAGIDISNLVGSTMVVTAFTNAAHGQATFSLKHGLSPGSQFRIVGATPSAFDLTYTVLAVVDPWNVTVTTDTSAFGAYSANSGTVSTNPRNLVVNLINYPDVYTVPIVLPPQQMVQLQLTWNTSSPFVVSASAVSQEAIPELVDYINSIPDGQPINIFELNNVFQQAVASLVSPTYITKLLWTVTIDGVATPPLLNTGIVQGDPEGYFFCLETGVVVAQG